MESQTLIVVLICGALAFLAGWLAGRSWLAVHLAAETRQNLKLLNVYRAFGRTVRGSYRDTQSRARRRLKVAEDQVNELRRDYDELETLQDQSAGVRKQLTESLETVNRRNKDLAEELKALEMSIEKGNAELDEARGDLNRKEKSARVFKTVLEERDRDLESLRANLHSLRQRVVPLTRAIEQQRRLIKQQAVQKAVESA